MMIKDGRQFNRITAHPALSKYISLYNLVFPEPDTFMEQYTLLPNACGTISLAFDGAAVTAELWGAAMAPFLLGKEPNRYHSLLLIQLSPYGLYQITKRNLRINAFCLKILTEGFPNHCA